MTKLIVLRHGQALHNIADTLSSDLGEKWSLTDFGKVQAHQAALKLKQEEKIIHFIFSSPFPRTKQTANLIAQEVGIQDIQIDDRLREPFFGEMEGKTYRELFSLFITPRDALLSGPPGGESGAAILKRVSDFLSDIAANPKYKDKAILIVTHGFIICQFYRYFKKQFNDIIPQTSYEVFYLHSTA
jgi:broad specificity phosphatase PhoE